MMNMKQAKYDFVVVNDDEGVECRRNLPAFKGINSVMETKEVTKKSKKHSTNWLSTLSTVSL